jgi:hypothetical protein
MRAVVSIFSEKDDVEDEVFRIARQFLVHGLAHVDVVFLKTRGHVANLLLTLK